ncbi:non-ribosomal peptide synthetase [Paenibacillus sp. Leaf72]|uniref:non-ribosomal peptide synthetase n=1 Tax=Paenibacillus sp. Leaf72 TaxID=1736234 RepID=UPI000B1AE6B0|nr:non-ribosomal peptide synthetase [Paenibacillus sp. Leaf72]
MNGITFQKEQVQDIYFLSPMQEGMLFHTLLHPGQSYYMEQLAISVKGSFRKELLEQSMNVLMDRYDIFRTVFLHEKINRPVQVVFKQRAFRVQEIDLCDQPREEQQRQLAAFKQQDKMLVFDLSKDILMRTTVFKTAEDTYEWIWSYHHIMLDGWCFGIIVKELFQIYSALLNHKPYELPVSKPYKEYINWLGKQDKEASLVFWSSYLAEFEGQESFAEQRSRRHKEGYSSGELHFKLGEEDSEAFSRLAREQQVTLSTAIQAVWAILLSRYQRSSDVLFGAVVSGRPAEISGVESMVGLFINVIPTRVQIVPDMTFKQLVSEMQRLSVQTEAHQYVPLYDIQSRIGQQTLIDHIVVFENYPLQEAGKQSDEQSLGFTMGDIHIFEKSNYDLNLLAGPGKEMVMKLAYNANVYESSFIKRLKAQLIYMIRQLVREFNKPLGELEIVPEEEAHRLFAFNRLDGRDGEMAAASNMTLAQRFEWQVENTPEHLALSAPDGLFTYAELNARANKLAYVLRGRGVNDGTIVGLLVHRSSDMIAAILAVLKAGAAYVPIDPAYPEQRISYMLEDSGAKLLLTQYSLTSVIEKVEYQGTLLYLDDPELYKEAAASNLDTGEAPIDTLATTPGGLDRLAYVMYTSGTTGQPKGALITHANISRIAINTNYIEITKNDNVLSLSNYAFDGFTFDLFGALLIGAALVLAPSNTIMHAGKLVQFIKEEKITVMFVTTALFNLLVDEEDSWMKSIRKVLFGGERSSVNHVRKALHSMGPDKIIHVYGPTESTVFATFYPVHALSEDMASIPIGKPLNQTSAYIVNETDQLQPIEAVGELILGGEGLALGYLNRTALTAEKFAPNPFVQGERIYRSGDLARWLPDGNIEFIGRVDDQVKIRGHRIELGEIEKQIVKLEQVKEALLSVACRASGEASLCAYVVLKPQMELSKNQLRNYLLSMLPNYMVPPAFVFLDRLPLTANGKVDRRSLPAMTEFMNESEHYAPPRNDTEARLAVVWCQVLGVARVGIHDDFFALGGHSLKAMTLCSIMLKEFQIDIPIKLLFETPTIAEIAAYLQEWVESGQTVSRASAHLTLLNPKGGPHLFAFPPVLGYGIVFKELADQLPNYRVHAFDFIEEEDRITHYASQMQSIQPHGSFILIGYSAGCALAFEVAKQLERGGRQVEVLIMIDSYWKNNVSDLKGRTVEGDVAELMEANKQNIALQIDAVREGIVRKTAAYYKYYVEWIAEGQVHTSIHLIQSETAFTLSSELSSWKRAAGTGEYVEHQGFGKHGEMLQGGFARLNAQTIRFLLKRRPVKK